MKISTRILRRGVIAAACAGAVAAVAAPVALADQTVCQTGRVASGGQSPALACVSVTRTGRHVGLTEAGVYLPANGSVGPFVVDTYYYVPGGKVHIIGTYVSGAIFQGPKAGVSWYGFNLDKTVAPGTQLCSTFTVQVYPFVNQAACITIP